MDKDFALDLEQSKAVMKAFGETYLGRALGAPSLSDIGNIMHFTVPCSDSGRPLVLGHVGSGNEWERPPIATAQELRATILSFVDHELRELLKLNGRRLFNPHGRIDCEESLTGDQRPYIEKSKLR
jgi:hypothetical protein